MLNTFVTILPKGALQTGGSSVHAMIHDKKSNTGSLRASFMLSGGEIPPLFSFGNLPLDTAWPCSPSIELSFTW
jgi:hypothetical protein